MIERVRLAAAISILARSKVRGGVITRSAPFSQRVFTPILLSTSIIRLTSSIRATRRSVVVPLFSKLAHSKATAAFLLVLTVISPESCVPPCTAKLILPAWFSFTIGRANTSPMRAIISRLIFCPPFSMRLMADWLVPSASASCVCVSPRIVRLS